MASLKFTIESDEEVEVEDFSDSDSDSQEEQISFDFDDGMVSNPLHLSSHLLA
jgi:hypothetical protein